MTEPDYRRLESDLDYRFRDLELLKTALTHKSYVNEKSQDGAKDNERLEFLGDAVLDLVIGHLLMDQHPSRSEGELSKMRAASVSEQALSEVASGLGLGEWLFLGKGEHQTGGRGKSSLLADTCEAVIAAVYLDGGFGAAFRVVEKLFSVRLQQAGTPGTDDYKTRLQELVQGSLRVAPRYALVAEQGPDHAKTFESAVFVGDKEIARGSGKTKKEAEQQAAKQALGELDVKLVK